MYTGSGLQARDVKGKQTDKILRLQVAYISVDWSLWKNTLFIPTLCIRNIIHHCNLGSMGDSNCKI